MIRRSQALHAALVAVLAAVACGEGGGTIEVPALPERLTADDVLYDYVGAWSQGSLAASFRVEGVQPARSRGRRLALLAPIGSVLESRLHAPDATILRVGTAVPMSRQEDERRETGMPIRFRVRIDDATAWERVWRPDAKRHWVDAEIGLPARGAGTLSFETEAAGPGARLGTPAWSRVQLVRRTIAPRQTSDAGRPNVLLLVVDTLRADRVGPYGASPSRTPNLDRLAAKGTVFLNTWAQAPWTLPSVATILTGRYPHEHGVVGRSADFGRPAGVEADDGNWSYLPDTIPTIASLLRRAGITTVGVTSNLLISRENNLARGFETFLELPVAPMPVQWARAAQVHATFDAWLEAGATHRFFAYLHYMEPHDPYVPGPGRRIDCPSGVDDDVCDGVIRALAKAREEGGPPIEEPIRRYLERLYDGEVQAWDAALPELLDILDRHDLRDRTVVLVTADHGEEFGEHGHLGHRKQLYVESTAVPLILVGPGVEAGTRDDLVELTDVLPTILGLMRVPVEAGQARIGRDLLAGATGRAECYAETRYGVGPGGRHALELLGVRRPAWAYQRFPALDTERLYDLRQDPGERHDLAAVRADVCRDLRASVAAWQAHTGGPIGVPTEAEAITDKLRALGYVE